MVLIPLPAGITPDMTMTPTAYLSFRPNPVGVNQLILVNLWLTDSPSQTRYFSDFKITFTKPDGTTDVLTLNSYYADGTAWFEYKVDQIGEWKVKFEFPQAVTSLQETTQQTPYKMLLPSTNPEVVEPLPLVSTDVILDQSTICLLLLRNKH